MRTYDYKCTDCSSTFEALLDSSEQVVKCHKCRGTNVLQLLSPPNFIVRKSSSDEFTYNPAFRDKGLAKEFCREHIQQSKDRMSSVNPYAQYRYDPNRVKDKNERARRLTREETIQKMKAAKDITEKLYKEHGMADKLGDGCII